jgi:uncharacterized FlaG/YvyC family protein
MMEVSQSYRSPAPALASAVNAPKQLQAEKAPTELPAPKSVTATDQALRTKNAEKGKPSAEQAQQSGTPPLQNQKERPSPDFELDPETQSLIYKAINEASGEVVRQIPTDAILQLRAYVKEGNAGGEQPPPDQNESTPFALEA